MVWQRQIRTPSVLGSLPGRVAARPGVPLDSPGRQHSSRRGGLLMVLALLAASVLPSCRMVDQQELNGKSPLSALDTPPKQTSLEILFVQAAARDDDSVRQLWEEVDEQAIAAETRRQLVPNGFRVGVIGSQLPPGIATLLQSAERVDGSGAEISDTSVGATRRRMFLRRGQRGELLASSVQPEFHVLQNHQGETLGRTFHDGQGQFSIQAIGTDDGRVRLQLVPEVHYGEFRNRYVPGEGMFRLDNRRRKQAFDRLRIDATVATGQLVVIGAHPGKPGSLGHRFFNEASSETSLSKLLMIRVVEIGSARRNPSDGDTP